MKRIVFLIAVVLSSTMIFGQTEKIRLSSIDANGGKGALGTGFFVTVNMNKGNNLFQITLNEERIFLNSFFEIKNTGISAGPTMGFFKNIPFAGVIGIFRPFGSKVVSTFHWVGFGFGQPGGKMSISPSFLFSVNTLNIDMWRIRTSYSVINFMKNKTQHVVCMKYSQKITENLSGYTEVGYDMTNKEQLLKMGVVYKF